MKRFLGTILTILFTVVTVSFAVLIVTGYLHKAEQIRAQSGKSEATDVGRYQIFNTRDLTFLLDTATGKTWKWVLTRLPNGDQFWGWERSR